MREISLLHLGEGGWGGSKLYAERKRLLIALLFVKGFRSKEDTSFLLAVSVPCCFSHLDMTWEILRGRQMPSDRLPITANSLLQQLSPLKIVTKFISLFCFATGSVRFDTNY